MFRALLTGCPSSFHKNSDHVEFEKLYSMRARVLANHFVEHCLDFSVLISLFEEPFWTAVSIIVYHFLGLDIPIRRPIISSISEPKSF